MHTCEIEYFSDDESGLVYPSVVHLDYSVDMCDEETYAITVSPCVYRKAGVCVDYDKVQNDYFSAMDSLASFGMVNRTSRQGFQRSSWPFQIWVADGTPKLIEGPTTSIDANTMLTIPDWLAQIKEHCISGCESESSLQAYHNFTVKYDSYMFPRYIFLDVDGAISGDEYEYTISDFAWMSCDEEPPSKAITRKPPTELTTTEPPSEVASSSSTEPTVYIGALAAITSLFYYY